MSFKKNRAALCKQFAGRYCLALLLNCGILSPIQAQDQINFTQFYLNPYLLNTAYVGLDGQPAASLFYHRQWMTIDGAPTIVNLSLQAPLNSRVSAGLNVTNDSKGFFDNTGVLFSLGYHVQIEDHTFVRFGISAGGSWNTVDMKKLEAVNDPALGGLLDKNASLAGNAGVSFHMRLFHFGIALPTIFSPAYVSRDAFTVKEVKPFQAVVLNAGNRFYFNSNKNIFEPYAVYRINTGLPAQLELAGLFHLNHVIWIGGSYKEDFGISGLGGLKMKNMLAIGASYAIPKRGVDELNSPSFEISLNYLFGAHKKDAPVYSFVNAVKAKERKPTPTAPREAVASKRQQEEAAQKKRAEAQAKQEQIGQKKRLDEQAKIKQEAAQKKQLETQAKLKQEEDEKKRQDEQAKLQGQEADRRKREDAERAALAEQNRINQEATAQKKLLEDQEKMRGEEIRQKQLAEKTLTAQQERVQPVDVPTANPPIEEHPQNDQESLQRPDVHADEPVKPIEDATAAAFTGRHEIIKRGSHEEDLEVSNYVIVGTFKSADNAKHFSDGLLNLNFDSQYGYLTERDLWYVYLIKTTDLEKARTEHAKLSKVFLLRDAWLLTVEP